MDRESGFFRMGKFMRHPGVMFALMAALVALDQGAKFWVRVTIPLCLGGNCDPVSLVPGLFELTHVINPGISWGFFRGLEESIRVPLLLGGSLIAFLLIGGFWLKQRRNMNGLEDYAFMLILGGAIGNLVDRFIPPHAVTDFLTFQFGDYDLFTNNLADIFISLGVMVYLIGMWAARKPAG